MHLLVSLLAVLLQESHVLSLGVMPHHSWWKDSGPGCGSHHLPAAQWQQQQNLELTTVKSCWLEYHYIEVLHCIIQLLISVSLVQVDWHQVLSQFPVAILLFFHEILKRLNHVGSFLRREYIYSLVSTSLLLLTLLSLLSLLYCCC